MHFHFDRAFQILCRTYPFVLLRLAVYVVVVGFSILWFGGIYLLFMDWPFPGPPWLAWVFGGLLFGKAFKLIKAYVLYLVKAGHVAVITRLVLQGELPQGTNQFSYATDLVSRHFLRVSVLFAVDALVRVVLKAFNRQLFRMATLIPGAGNLRGFFQRVLDYSLGYIDEAILSYTLTQPGRNPWSSAKDGLLLYVQNWKTILGSGFVLALISYGVAALFLVPGAILAYVTPGLSAKIIGGILAGAGLLVKFAVVDPFALTSVVVNYHYAIAGQSPNPAWTQRLEEVSGKFKEFNQRAKEWGLTESGPPPAPSQP